LELTHDRTFDVGGSQAVLIVLPAMRAAKQPSSRLLTAFTSRKYGFLVCQCVLWFIYPSVLWQPGLG